MPAAALKLKPLASGTCLRFADLTVGYGNHPAVHHLSGALAAGSLTAVIGPNGSGKSTLIKAIVGLVRPMSGSVTRAAETSMAYLPQQSELDRSFPARIADLVGLGLWPRRGLLGRHRAEDRAAVTAALDAVGLTGFERRPVDSLSGGQFQRALFARVIVQDARLILLDEPFNAVDSRTVADLVELIRGWHRDGRTVVVVVHDLDLVRREFPETLLLARQAIAWGATAEVVTAANLSRARHFHEAWDDTAPWCEPSGSGIGHGHDHGPDIGHLHGHQNGPDDRHGHSHPRQRGAA